MSLKTVRITVEYVSADRLIPMEDVRFVKDAMKDEELLSSIQEWGVRETLLARPHPDPELKQQGKLQVVDGRRRLRIGKIAGLTEFPVEVREMEDEEAYTMALVKNLQRADVADTAVANWLNLMQMKFVLTQEQLAKKVGKSQGWVSRMLSLWKQATSTSEKKPLQMTERQSRALKGMSEETRSRILEESKIMGEVPYSGRDLERKSKAEFTAEQVLEKYGKHYDDEFLIFQLVEDAGLTITDAKNTVAKWKLGNIQKRKKMNLEYVPKKSNKEVQLFKELGKYYPLEIIDEVSKISGPVKTLETYLRHCRRYVTKLFHAAPMDLRQSVLEEFKI